MNLLLALVFIIGNPIKFQGSKLIFNHSSIKVNTQDLIFSPSMSFVAFIQNGNLSVYNSDGKLVRKILIEGENLPSIKLMDDGSMAVFYLAVYNLIVYDGAGKIRLYFRPRGNYFYYESYSDFDQNGKFTALAYKKDNNSHLVVFKNFQKKFTKIFKNYLPARVWVRGSSIFLRLYRVEDNHVTSDFVLMLDSNGKMVRKFEIPKVNFVDKQGNLIALASKREVYIFQSGERSSITGIKENLSPFPTASHARSAWGAEKGGGISSKKSVNSGVRFSFEKIIYDVKIHKGRVYIIIGEPNRRKTTNPEIYEISEKPTKILNLDGTYLYPHFYESDGKLYFLTEKGDIHEL